MAALMVAVTILTILTAAALPMWSQQMQRENEEELIFRGWQYAEAIRVFQQRHGRLPTRLEELIEIEPRSIRKLWKDPMTEDGEWGIVVQVGAGGAPPGTQQPRNLQSPSPPGSGQVGGDPRVPRNPNGRAGGAGAGGEGVCVGAGGGGEEEAILGGPTRSRGSATGGGRGEQPQVTGPIIGVCSRAEGEALKVLFGEERYSDWHFTVLRLQAPRGQVGGDPRDAYPQRAKWIGRPFRPGIQPEGGAPPPGSLPGGNLPNDKNP